MITLQRTVVIGTSGSGKTTLARTLAGILSVDHIELDALHWRPGWTPAPREELRALVSEAVAAERWVLDGNYRAVRDIVWPRATGIVWLNYSFALVFSRVLTRTLRRALRREILFAGNRESLRKSFLSRDSILWWVITTYQRRRREYPVLFTRPEYAHLSVIIHRTPADTERFLEMIRRSAARPE